MKILIAVLLILEAIRGLIQDLTKLVEVKGKTTRTQDLTLLTIALTPVALSLINAYCT